MPRGMDEELWLENETDREREEEEETTRQHNSDALDEYERESAHESRIHDGYYNEFDD